MENTTNVIYITSNCNLKCEYCFEEEKRPNRTMTYDDIDRYFEGIDKISAPHSHIVLFGGEPLLYPDLIEYIVIDKILKQYDYKQYSVSMTSNGLRLLEDDIYDWFFDLRKKKYIHLEISYDGPNCYRRKDKNGNCVNHLIEKVLNKLNNDNKTFAISYTLNKDNYNYCIEDMITLFETYDHLEKIILSIASQDLDVVDNDYQKSVLRLKPYLNEIYRRYRKPICEEVCDVCQKCVFNNKNLYAVPNVPYPIERSKFANEDFSLWEYCHER